MQPFQIDSQLVPEILDTCERIYKETATTSSANSRHQYLQLLLEPKMF